MKIEIGNLYFLIFIPIVFAFMYYSLKKYKLYNKNEIVVFIRPANNSQVKYKKIILIKNCMTNKPFQNTNDYKIWIF